MATDTDTSSVDDPIAKGGVFGGPFDSTGLDANVRALLVDFRWTTSSEGPHPATTIPYSFPTQTSDYTSVPGGYAAPNLLVGFAELTADQKDAVRTAFDLVSSYTGVTFIEVSSGLAVDSAIRIAHYGQGGSEAYLPSAATEMSRRSTSAATASSRSRTSLAMPSASSTATRPNITVRSTPASTTTNSR